MIGSSNVLRHGRTLIVDSISDSIVQKWNEQKPEQAIQVGDEWLEVNGIALDPDAMLEKLKSKEVLQVKVLRESDVRRRSPFRPRQKVAVKSEFSSNGPGEAVLKQGV